MKIKGIHTYKQLLAILVAGGISTSLVGCSKNEEKKPVVNSEKLTSSDYEFTGSSIEKEIVPTTVPSTEEIVESQTTTVPSTEEMVELQTTTTCPIKMDEDGKKGVFVNGYENDYNIYVEGNAYFYGIDDANVEIVTESNTPAVEEVTTTAQEVTTTAAPQTTVQEVTTTAAPQTTVQEVTTAAPQTTVQEVTTTAAPQTTMQEYSYNDIDLVRFEGLTQNLVNEFDRVGLVKAKGQKYTKADLYSTVYLYNCDYIDEDLKQQLIAKNYIADDIASVLVAAASPRDAIMTDTETKAILNTNLDEVCFGIEYFKSDENVFFTMESDEEISYMYNYNSTDLVNNRVTEKLKKLDIEEYFAARNKFYKKSNINTSVVSFHSHSDNPPKEFIDRDFYKLEDFVDVSVAINDPEARQNVKRTLNYVVEASLDNSKAFNSLVSFSNFYMGDKEHTYLVDCGAGATFAMNTYIYAYSDFLCKNPHKTLQGFAKDEKQLKQFKIRYNRIVEDSQDLSDVVRIYESCTKKLTK